MGDTVLGLLEQYGPWILFTLAFLSCLTLPAPSSLGMLTAGGLSATGDMVLADVFIASYIGGVFGDQAGYFLGLKCRPWVMRYCDKRPKMKVFLDRATQFIQDRGGFGIFLSRWLISPLGPHVNIAAGVVAMPWVVFTIGTVIGDVIWVGMYVGLGYVFFANISSIADLVGWIVGGATLIFIAYWIIRSRR